MPQLVSEVSSLLQLGSNHVVEKGSTYASVARSNLPSSSAPQNAPQTVSDDPSDLIAASLERSRANLERFQRQQAAAVSMDQFPEQRSRRRRQADVPDLFGGDPAIDSDGEVEVIDPPRREREARLRREREREEQEMERAIAASLAESGQSGEEVPTATRGNAGAQPMEEDEELDDDGDEAFDFHSEARLYDDEDAQLQAAINASLQEQALPADWKPPAVETVTSRSAERAADVQPKVEPQPEVAPVEVADEEGDEEEPAVEELSAEELRRKRLERFK
jgi:ataxin-3